MTDKIEKQLNTIETLIKDKELLASKIEELLTKNKSIAQSCDQQKQQLQE